MDLLQSALAVLDIDSRSVPLDDISLLIAQRHGADQDPAIYPVGAPQTQFILALFPDSHVRTPLFHDPWGIFWMNCAHRICKSLLQRQARVFKPTLIGEIKSAVRQQSPDHHGDCVDHKPKPILALSQRVSRELCFALLDGVCAHSRRPVLPQAARSKRPAFFALFAAPRSPAWAATMHPAINICHCLANPSGSRMRASPASCFTNVRIVSRCLTAAIRTRCPRSPCSSSAFTKKHPSKSGRRNHLSKTSKMASNFAPGVRALRSAPRCSQDRVHSSSRRRRNASARASFEG